jgi:hypothetical protein
MKNIIKSTLVLLCSICMFTSCDDDLSNNPTLLSPQTFVLNTPSYSTSNIDLASSTGLPFTWSQPNYGGFPVAAQYQMQFSITNSFTTSVEEAEADETGSTVADYVTLDQIYSSCNGEVNPTELARGLQRLAKWDKSEVPSTLPLYVRLSSNYSNDIIYSNVVMINIIPYYVELSDAPVDLWYLIGADIADGTWADNIGTSVIPLQPIEGEEYDKKTGQGKIQWIGYLAGNGFKLKHVLGSWDEQWGQGGSFGEFVKNDGGSGNITVPAAGIYRVTLDTKEDELTIEEYTAADPVFDGMCIAGSFNEWGDTPMNPCNANAENHDWYLEYTFAAGDEVKFKQPGSWDYNRGGTFITEGDDLYGFGVGNGANLMMPADGTYIILFNDITGVYRFIKK